MIPWTTTSHVVLGELVGLPPRPTTRVEPSILGIWVRCQEANMICDVLEACAGESHLVVGRLTTMMADRKDPSGSKSGEVTRPTGRQPVATERQRI